MGFVQVENIKMGTLNVIAEVSVKLRSVSKQLTGTSSVR